MERCTTLVEEIEWRSFPPCILLRLRYDVDPTMWTSKQNVLLIVKDIMDPTDHIQYPLQVKVPGNNGKKRKHAAKSSICIWLA